MTLDEEALSNEQARALPPTAEQEPDIEGQEMAADGDEGAPVEPPPDAASDAPPAARRATPQESKMLSTVLRQALSLLTSEQYVDYIIKSIDNSQPPAKILAGSVARVIQGIAGSAYAAGIKLPAPVIEASMNLTVKAVAALMVKAGLVKDAAALTAETVQLISAQGAEKQPQQPEPQQPPMEAANVPA